MLRPLDSSLCLTNRILCLLDRFVAPCQFVTGVQQVLAAARIAGPLGLALQPLQALLVGALGVGEFLLGLALFLLRRGDLLLGLRQLLLELPLRRGGRVEFGSLRRALQPSRAVLTDALA